MSVSRFAVIFCVVLIRKTAAGICRIGEGNQETSCVNPFARRSRGLYARCRLVIRRRSLQLIEQALKRQQIVGSRFCRHPTFLAKITEATLFDVPIFVMAGTGEALYKW